ncbi:MAG: galactose ABC transporter substrate-binding protein [Clostridiales bacterium]|nr:galactose ABC transporter substrate-binding protein [Clostridiales bacterium]
MRIQPRIKELWVIGLFLAVCLAAAIQTGCSKVSPMVAFFVYDGSDTFISEMMEDITARIPPDISFVVRDAGNSQAVQNQQIVELIGKSYDLFIINAVDRLACSSIVEKCQKEGVPVVFFNREPLADALTGSNAFYVGAAADSLGKKQADMAAALFGNDFSHSPYDKNGDNVVQAVILKGEQGHQDAEKRTDNCVSRLKALGFSVDVLAVESANWRRQEAYEAMDRLYTLFGERIELVFANNDDMALGAIDYLLSVNVFKRGPSGVQPFPIVGVDGTEVGLEAIGEGLLYGTVNNDSANQGEAILALLDSIIYNRDMNEFPFEITNNHYVYIDGDIITKENLAEYTKIAE